MSARTRTQRLPVSVLSRVTQDLRNMLVPGLHRRLAHLEQDIRSHGERLKRIQKQCESMAATLHTLANTRARGESDMHRAANRSVLSSTPTGPKMITFPEQWLALAMRDPAQVRRNLEAMAREQHGTDVTLGESLRVEFPLDRLVDVPHADLWSDPPGHVIATATEDLIEAASHFSISVLEEHYGPNISFDQAGYLRATRIRVLALVEELARRGVTSGHVLEVGSLWGSFALPLQRLGFQVTAVDRYREYESLEPVIELLERAGVEVVKTTRADETAVLHDLDQFDVVIAMAVIEHIPHTPRTFLESLVSRVRTGGLLTLDTPNLVRYWNRVAVAEGRSPLMDIKSQYFTQIPYEGHHREYTGPELVWMMEQAGCEDVRLRYLDYNMVQFDKIHKPHLECVRAMVHDPTTADTLIASGMVARR